MRFRFIFPPVINIFVRMHEKPAETKGRNASLMVPARPSIRSSVFLQYSEFGLAAEETPLIRSDHIGLKGIDGDVL